MATTNLIEDIFFNLFTEKYCISVVLDTLASCETNGTLNGLIKRFHPNYFDNKQNKVLELPLLKDLQLL